jgi:serine/threonine protein kinase
MIGNVVGNYKIVEKIGEGGMGSVFKGIDMMLEREVAIKVLRPELAGQPEIVERFRSEAVTLARLNHPKIATLYSFFRHRDDFMMVMEFVPGQTLGDVIVNRGALKWSDAIPMICQALEGIDHAHSLGIVHRDVKPANMMLTASGTVKVMDFGIARVLGTARMTRAGHLIGTIEYMSPEQVKGQHTDARSDIYSSGIVLYELLTGRVPFSSDSEFDLMRSQIEEPPPPPRVFAKTIPEAIELAILRALAKNPGERFETAGEFREALLEVTVPSNVVTNSTARVQPLRQSNSGSYVSAGAPPATRMAGSREFPERPNEAHIKGTRIAAAGETFSTGSQNQIGLHRGDVARPVEKAFVNESRASRQSLFSTANTKLYLGAGMALIFLAVASIASIVFIMRGNSTELVPKLEPAVSQSPSNAGGANPTGQGIAPRPGPAPNDAASMGIDLRPDDRTGRANENGNTKKETESTGTESEAKDRRQPVKKASRSDATPRPRTDDRASKRSKALNALDQ